MMILFSVILLVLFTTFGKNILVDPKIGEDNSLCLQGDEGKKCKTLTYAFDHAESNVAIYIIPDIEIISTSVHFTTYSNSVSFKGKNKNVTICSNSSNLDPLFNFANSISFTVSDLTFKNVKKGVFSFEKCKSLTLTNLTFKNIDSTENISPLTFVDCSVDLLNFIPDKSFSDPSHGSNEFFSHISASTTIFSSIKTISDSLNSEPDTASPTYIINAAFGIFSDCSTVVLDGINVKRNSGCVVRGENCSTFSIINSFLGQESGLQHSSNDVEYSSKDAAEPTAEEYAQSTVVITGASDITIEGTKLSCLKCGESRSCCAVQGSVSGGLPQTRIKVINSEMKYSSGASAQLLLNMDSSSALSTLIKDYSIQSSSSLSPSSSSDSLHQFHSVTSTESLPFHCQTHTSPSHLKTTTPITSSISFTLTALTLPPQIGHCLSVLSVAELNVVSLNCDGGGSVASGSLIVLSNSSKAQFSWDEEAEVSGIVSSFYSSGNGAGLFVDKTKEVNISHIWIQNAEAKKKGGGIFFGEGVENVFLFDVSMSQCDAEEEGRCICWEAPYGADEPQQGTSNVDFKYTHYYVECIGKEAASFWSRWRLIEKYSNPNQQNKFPNYLAEDIDNEAVSTAAVFSLKHIGTVIVNWDSSTYPDRDVSRSYINNWKSSGRSSSLRLSHVNEASLTGIRIDHVVSTKGSALAVDATVKVLNSESDLDIRNSVSEADGGGLALLDYDMDDPEQKHVVESKINIDLTTLKLSNCTSKGRGGGGYFLRPVRIESAKVNEVYAVVDGACFYVSCKVNETEQMNERNRNIQKQSLDNRGKPNSVVQFNKAFDLIKGTISDIKLSSIDGKPVNMSAITVVNCTGAKMSGTVDNYLSFMKCTTDAAHGGMISCAQTDWAILSYMTAGDITISGSGGAFYFDATRPSTSQLYQLDILTCTFYRCTSLNGNGGAIVVALPSIVNDNSMDKVEMMMDHVTLSNCVAEKGFGGGMYFQIGSGNQNSAASKAKNDIPSIYHLTYLKEVYFTSCSALCGGGFYASLGKGNDDHFNVSLSQCRFNMNSATKQGGALYVNREPAPATNEDGMQIHRQNKTTFSDRVNSYLAENRLRSTYSDRAPGDDDSSLYRFNALDTMFGGNLCGGEGQSNSSSQLWRTVPCGGGIFFHGPSPLPAVTTQQATSYSSSSTLSSSPTSISSPSSIQSDNSASQSSAVVPSETLIMRLSSCYFGTNMDGAIHVENGGYVHVKESNFYDNQHRYLTKTSPMDAVCTDSYLRVDQKNFFSTTSNQMSNSGSLLFNERDSKYKMSQSSDQFKEIQSNYMANDGIPNLLCDDICNSFTKGLSDVYPCQYPAPTSLQSSVREVNVEDYPLLPQMKIEGRGITPFNPILRLTRPKDSNDEDANPKEKNFTLEAVPTEATSRYQFYLLTPQVMNVLNLGDDAPLYFFMDISCDGGRVWAGETLRLTILHQNNAGDRHINVLMVGLVVPFFILLLFGAVACYLYSQAFRRKKKKRKTQWKSIDDATTRKGLTDGAEEISFRYYD